MKTLAASWRMVLPLATLVTGSLLAGCATLVESGKPLLPTIGAAQDAAGSPATPRAGFITVEMRPEKSLKPDIKQVPLQDPMFVQQALQAAGAAKRFRNMDIQVVRMVGDNPQRMDAKFKRGTHTVDPAYDYALQTGDHLIVTETRSTALEDMARTLGVPLGLTPGTKNRPRS